MSQVFILIFIPLYDDVISVNYYLYHDVHWSYFWVGDYPLNVWLLNPSIIYFSPRCESIGDYQASCYLMLIYMEL